MALFRLLAICCIVPATLFASTTATSGIEKKAIDVKSFQSQQSAEETCLLEVGKQLQRLLQAALQQGYGFKLTEAKTWAVSKPQAGKESDNLCAVVAEIPGLLEKNSCLRPSPNNAEPAKLDASNAGLALQNLLQNKGFHTITPTSALLFDVNEAILPLFSELPNLCRKLLPKQYTFSYLGDEIKKLPPRTQLCYSAVGESLSILLQAMQKQGYAYKLVNNKLEQDSGAASTNTNWQNNPIPSIEKALKKGQCEYSAPPNQPMPVELEKSLQSILQTPGFKASLNEQTSSVEFDFDDTVQPLFLGMFGLTQTPKDDTTVSFWTWITSVVLLLGIGGSLTWLLVWQRSTNAKLKNLEHRLDELSGKYDKDIINNKNWQTNECQRLARQLQELASDLEQAKAQYFNTPPSTTAAELTSEDGVVIQYQKIEQYWLDFFNQHRGRETPDLHAWRITGLTLANLDNRKLFAETPPKWRILGNTEDELYQADFWLIGPKDGRYEYLIPSQRLIAQRSIWLQASKGTVDGIFAGIYEWQKSANFIAKKLAKIEFDEDRQEVKSITPGQFDFDAL